MKLQTHTLLMITADIAASDRPRSGKSSEIDLAILARCDELAQEHFRSDATRITSHLADSGLFTALSSDGKAAISAVASLVDAVEAEYKQTSIRLRLAVHSIDATDTSMGSAADARYANLLRIAAHGGQILISDRAYSSLNNALPSRLSLRDLGQHQMPDLSQPAHIFQLLTTEHPRIFPQIRSLNGGRHNLVTPISRFIGREDDMQTVADQVRANRMVTLVGAPGLGKTRLAVQTAATMVEEMADGAWFVEIPLLPDPSLVVPAIAAALKVVEDPDASLLESVVTALERKRVLLVMDNCDIVRRECAAAIETIFDRCPGVRVLASGSEAVGVQGEVVHELRTLTMPVPDAESGASPLSIRATEAGELRFNDFASKANPGVHPDTREFAFRCTTHQCRGRDSVYAAGGGACSARPRCWPDGGGTGGPCSAPHFWGVCLSSCGSPQHTGVEL